MRTRGLWGTAIGLFGGNYAWFFLLNWLPYYFETEKHYTKDKLALLGSLPFLAIAASSTCFGLLADFLIHRGHEAGRVRQTFLCFGLSGCCGLMLAAVLVKDEWHSNILLVLAFISMGAWSSNHWAFAQFLSGPATAGKWTGVQNCIGNFAGVLGPVVSGYAFKITHSFVSAFAIASGFLVMSVASYWFVVGKPEQIFHKETELKVLESPVGAS
jgi:MFS family permease